MAKLPIVLGVIGVVVGVLALVFGFVLFPMIFKKKIAETGQLVNGTAKWESWREVPVPVFQQIYIFNVTNSKDVIKGEKPILEELGPYVYQQKRTKVDIDINEEKDTISYKHRDVYFFREDLSAGSLDDKITVLNLPYLGAAYKSQLAGATARYIVAEILNEYPKESLYVNITVDEFFFGGYHVSFMQELSDMKGEVLLPNNTFGLYYGRNGSESGTYEVIAGVKNPQDFAKVVSFNGQTSLGIFDNEQCDQVEGYDGSSMAPFLTRDKEFYLFVPALCRKMKFAWSEDTEMDGIPAFRFTVPEMSLADVHTNPDNMCYCSNQEKDGEKCFKSGVWEIAQCKGGTPMVMSFPHFYRAPEYLEQSVGLKPDKEKHEMTIILEPTAAISLQVAMRMQMNFALKPAKHFKPLKNIPEMLHPIFWMDQGVTLAPPMLQMVKDKLIKTQAMVRLGTWVGVGVGALIFIAALLCCFRKPKKSVYSTTQYTPSKKISVSSPKNIYEEIPANSTWSAVTPTEKYAKITSPPNPRAPLATPEEELQPFIPQNQNGYIISNPSPVPAPDPVITFRAHSPAIRINSNPTIVGMHPKSEDASGKDEIDDGRSPQVNPIPTALGAPFPPQNQFSSSGSMNRDLNEIDCTLKGINDALSSYENLKQE